LLLTCQVYLAHPEAQAKVNNRGQSPLDVAALRGYWKSVEVLLSHGAQSAMDREQLVRHVLARWHYNTAARLIVRGYGTCMQALMVIIGLRFISFEILLCIFFCYSDFCFFSTSSPYLIGLGTFSNADLEKLLPLAQREWVMSYTVCNAMFALLFYSSRD
jgi:hypothetical protein